MVKLELADFLLEHWFLTSTLFVLIISYIGFELKVSSNNSRISCQTAIGLSSHQGAVIIDIREKDSYKNQHIINSVNIPKTEIVRELKKSNKYNEKVLIIVCDTGRCSAAVVKELNSIKMENVFELEGGLQAWKEASLPLITKDKKN